MSKKKLLITEDEKKYILSMYGIIKENNQGGPEKLNIFGEEFFESGRYLNLSKTGKDKLELELSKAIIFLNKHKGKPTSIKILASEDSDQNYDRELDPTGKKSNDYILADGMLATKRAETIKKFLTDYFERSKASGQITTIPTFETPTIIVGTGTTPAQKKFDRRVEISFSITSDIDCLNGLVIQLKYVVPSDCPPPDKPGDPKKTHCHNCNNAVYQIKINNKLLIRADGKEYASLNNEERNTILDNPSSMMGIKTSDNLPRGYRNNVFVVNEKLAKELLTPNEQGIVPEKFDITVICRNADKFGGKTVSTPKWGRGCHDGVGTMTFKRAGSSTEEVVEKKTPRGENEEMLFVSINACGNKID